MKFLTNELDETNCGKHVEKSFPHVENFMWKTCYGGAVSGNNFVTIL